MLKINSATRAFAIVAAYWRNDLDGVLALVGDAELWPIVVEIPAGALLRLVGPDELKRPVTAWLDERGRSIGGMRGKAPASRCSLRDLGAHGRLPRR
jgi:hypothetical protein